MTMIIKGTPTITPCFRCGELRDTQYMRLKDIAQNGEFIKYVCDPVCQDKRLATDAGGKCCPECFSHSHDDRRGNATPDMCADAECECHIEADYQSVTVDKITRPLATALHHQFRSDLSAMANGILDNDTPTLLTFCGLVILGLCGVVIAGAL